MGDPSRSIEIEICLRLNRGRTEVRTTRRPNLAQKCRKLPSLPVGLGPPVATDSTRGTDPFASDERHNTHRCPQYYSPRRPVRRQSRRSARSGQIGPNWPSGALRPATATTPISVFARDGHIYRAVRINANILQYPVRRGGHKVRCQLTFAVTAQ